MNNYWKTEWAIENFWINQTIKYALSKLFEQVVILQIEIIMEFFKISFHSLSLTEFHKSKRFYIKLK